VLVRKRAGVIHLNQVNSFPRTAEPLSRGGRNEGEGRRGVGLGVSGPAKTPALLSCLQQRWHFQAGFRPLHAPGLG
jgi:hypothetical protein